MEPGTVSQPIRTQSGYHILLLRAKGDALQGDVTLAEVAKHLACTRYKCRFAGARLKLLRKRPSSGFVGGMP